MSQSTPNRMVSTFIGLCAPLLWSIYPVLLLSMGGVPPFEVLAMGFSISFVMSLVLWQLRGKSIRRIICQPMRYWFVGIGGILGFNSLYTMALMSAPPAEAFLVAATWPLISLLLDAWMLKERLRNNHIIGCLLGFSGLTVIAVARGADAPDIHHLLGYLAALIAAVIWAAYSVTIKRKPFPEPEFIGAICGGVAVGAGILHLLLEPSVVLHFQQWWRLLLIGIGPVGVAYYCWNHGVAKGDLRALSSLAFLGHFSTTGLLIFFGYAQFSWQIAVAFSLIIGGAFVGSLGLFLKKNPSVSEAQ